MRQEEMGTTKLRQDGREEMAEQETARAAAV